MCGSNSETSFSPEGTGSSFRTRRSAWPMRPLQPRQDLLEPLGQPPRRRVVGLPPEGLEHPPALGPGPLGRGDEPAVGRLQRLAALLALAAGDPVQLLRQLADGADPAAERLLQPGGGLAQRGPGPPQQPRDDPHAVADQAAVGGEVDVGLDRRGVDPELAAAGHLQRPGQLDHPVVERLERLRADGVGPADQRGVVGDLLEVDAAELAEHQAVVDEVLGLRVAPAVEPHDHEHAEDDLHRGGGPAAGAGPGVSGGPGRRGRASTISSSSSRRSSCSSWGSKRRPSWGTRANRSVRL